MVRDHNNLFNIMSQSAGKSSAVGRLPMKDKALVKIIVLGCANVGKTSIMERFDDLFLDNFLFLRILIVIC